MDTESECPCLEYRMIERLFAHITENIAGSNPIFFRFFKACSNRSLSFRGSSCYFRATFNSQRTSARGKGSMKSPRPSGPNHDSNESKYKVVSSMFTSTIFTEKAKKPDTGDPVAI